MDLAEKASDSSDIPVKEEVSEVWISSDSSSGEEEIQTIKVEITGQSLDQSKSL